MPNLSNTFKGVVNSLEHRKVARQRIRKKHVNLVLERFGMTECNLEHTRGTGPES